MNLVTFGGSTNEHYNFLISTLVDVFQYIFNDFSTFIYTLGNKINITILHGIHNKNSVIKFSSFITEIVLVF